MTYMWQETRGELIFRFQTDEPKIAAKMRRRKKRFSLVGCGMNCKFWIYKAGFSSPQKARKALSNLTGRQMKKDVEDGVYCA